MKRNSEFRIRNSEEERGRRNYELRMKKNSEFGIRNSEN